MTPSQLEREPGRIPGPGAWLGRHAIAQVDDPRAERPRLDQLEIEPALALRVEGDATADHHRVDDGAELVDQTQLGGLAGEGGATDPDVAVSRLTPQPLDLLDQAAGGEPGIPLHGRQRCREHNLREGPPYGSPLEGVEVQRRTLVGRLPVRHRPVKPWTHPRHGKLPTLTGPAAKD